MGNDDELARAVGKRMPEVSVEFFPGVDLLTASSVWDTIIGVKGGRIDYLVCEFTEGPVGDFEMEDLLTCLSSPLNFVLSHSPTYW
jgi:hypothetical protein